MKKLSSGQKELVLTLIAILIVGGTAFGLTRSLFSNSDDPPDAQTASPDTQGEEPKIYKVGLNSTSIEPVTVRLRQGEYVQFNSEDGKPHRITQAGGGEHGEDALDSGEFTTEQGYRVQFKDIGTFALHDKANPSVPITISVVKWK